MYVINKNDIGYKVYQYKTIKLVCTISYIENEYDIYRFLNLYEDSSATLTNYAYVVGEHQELVYKNNSIDKRNLSYSNLLLEFLLKNYYTNMIVHVKQYALSSYYTKEQLANMYIAITKDALNKCEIEDIKNYVRIGVLFHQANENVTKEILTRYNYKILKRANFQKRIIFVFRTYEKSKTLKLLDQLIVDKIILSYKIWKKK